MSTKVEIYNLALSALLLSKQVINPETETSTEVKILNLHWDTALESTIQDLDLDATVETATLELLATLSGDLDAWDYAYKYPSNCVFFRRIVSGQVTDNKSTHIAKATGQYDGQKAIYTNEESATAEFIPKGVNLDSLTGMAAMAVAYRLAMLSAPLLVGKGARTLRKELKEDYLIAKLEAQETDSLENFNYEADYLRSEFVQARLS